MALYGLMTDGSDPVARSVQLGGLQRACCARLVRTGIRGTATEQAGRGHTCLETGPRLPVPRRLLAGPLLRLRLLRVRSCPCAEGLTPAAGSDAAVVEGAGSCRWSAAGVMSGHEQTRCERCDPSHGSLPILQEGALIGRESAGKRSRSRWFRRAHLAVRLMHRDGRINDAAMLLHGSGTAPLRLGKHPCITRQWKPAKS